MLTAALAIAGSWTTSVLLRASWRAETGAQLRRATRRSRWRLPPRPRRWLERAIEDAALDLEPEGACELWVGTVLAVTTLGFALTPGAAPLAAMAGLAAGPCALRVASGRAQRRFVVALPSALEQVAAALRGGSSVPEALGGIADAGGPLAADLRRVRARAALGDGVADALASWAHDRNLGTVRATAGGLVVAVTVGGPAAHAIDGLASSLREQLGAVAEARALSSQARLSAIVVGLAPVAYFAFSAVADPASVGALFSTAAGRVCFVLGLTLEALAVVWMRRIVRTEDFA